MDLGEILKAEYLKKMKNGFKKRSLSEVSGAFALCINARQAMA